MNIAEERAALLAQAESLQKRAASLEERDVTEELAKDCAQAQCSREKYWSELSIEEKIERTRQMVKNYEHAFRQIDRLEREIRKLRSALRSHRHQVDDGGRVLYTTDDNPDTIGHGYLGGLDKSLENPDPSKVYF